MPCQPRRRRPPPCRADALRGRQIALEQQRRRFQQLRRCCRSRSRRRRSAAVGDVDVDAEQIANRVRVLARFRRCTVVRPRTAAPRPLASSVPSSASMNFARSFRLGLRLLARRHRADARACAAPFPRSRHPRARCPGTRSVERQVGRQIRVVVAVRAVAVAASPIVRRARLPADGCVAKYAVPRSALRRRRLRQRRPKFSLRPTLRGTRLVRRRA